LRETLPGFNVPLRVKEQLEELERWAADVVFGRARGFRASLMRFLMLALSGLFRILVWLRLWLYRSGWRPQRHLGVRVISVGNLTMGGTGKTPVVELLARSLRDHGRRVAILSRGYKSRRLERPQRWRDASNRPIPSWQMPKVVSTGNELLLDSVHAGDEPYMLAKNLDGVAVLAGKNRTLSGLFAIRHLAADTLLLDDGMQHLDLARSREVVLVDASSPFGTGALLPRGTLREPPAHLARASHILITRCDGSSNEVLINRLRRYNGTADIIECTHGPVHLENVFTGEREPLEFLKGKWVGAISAIAMPEAFEASLRKLGARVEIARRFADHHRFQRRDIERFMQRCVERDMQLILTTEKDAVRFPRPRSIDVPIHFLRIEVRILRGAETWDELIRGISRVDPAEGLPLRHLHARAC
jgi:tetraacyldisaccharide 4'-kinase